MDRLPVNSPPTSTAGFELLTYRPGDDCPVSIRTLSASYHGCFVHYVKLPNHPRAKSQYCPGRVCECQHKRTPRSWRGYAAALRYDRDRKLWIPCCLEITEHCERFMRGFFRRGQEWLITKVKQEGHKNFSIEATFRQLIESDSVPAAFDVKPCLQRLFHYTDIELGYPNPLPPRTMVTAIAGDKPMDAIETNEGVPVSKEEFDRLFKERGGFLHNFGKSENINGKR